MLKRRAQLGSEMLEPRRLLTVAPTPLPVLNLEPTLDTRLLGEQDSVIVAAQIDMNLDGVLDLVTADRSFAGISVFLGDSQSSFAAAQRFPFPGEVTSLTLADFDQNGRPDVAVSSSAGTSVLTNLGTTGGTWRGLSLTVFAAGGASSVVGRDVTLDGHDDLVIGIGDRIRVYSGNGNGTVAGPIDYVGAPGVRFIRIADVDGDQDPDLVVVNRQLRQISLLLNDGEGFFEEFPTTWDTIDDPATLEVGDLNNDGQVDVVVGYSSQTTGNLAVFLGQGEYEFRAPDRYNILGPVNALSIGDFDQRDGDDLVIAHAGTFHHPINANGPGGVSVMINRGDGSYFDPIRISTPGTIGAFWGDVNRDGWSDITTVQTFGGVASIALQRRDGAFTDRAANYDMGELTDAVLLDLNNDQRTDLLAVNFDDTTSQYRFTPFLGREDGSYFAGTEVFVDSEPRQLLTGDFTGDGRVEVAWVEAVGESLALHVLPNSLVGLQATAMVVTPIEGRQVMRTVVADLNQDGVDDIVLVTVGDTDLRVQSWIGQGAGEFSLGQSTEVASSFTALVLGHFNDDSILDIGVTEFNLLLQSGRFRPLLGIGDGRFTEATSLTGGGFTYLGDFNGDGHTDLVFVAGLLGVTVRASYGDGNGGFGPLQTVLTSDKFLTLGVADTNGDGRSDLIYDGAIEFGSDDGLTSPVPYAVTFNAGDVVVADMVGDATADTIVVSLDSSATNPNQFAFVTELVGGPDGPERAVMGVLKITNYRDIVLEDVDADGDLDALLLHARGFSVLTNSRQPVLGDANRDRVVDARDIDFVCSMLGTSRDDARTSDLDGDGVVTWGDVDMLVETILDTVAGDVDLDGEVGFADFIQLSFNFGTTAKGWEHADFNCDGQVAFDDFLLLASNFGFVRQA